MSSDPSEIKTNKFIENTRSALEHKILEISNSNLLTTDDKQKERENLSQVLAMFNFISGLREKDQRQSLIFLSLNFFPKIIAEENVKRIFNGEEENLRPSQTLYKEKNKSDQQVKQIN